jgi:hypothetical protein
LQDKKMSSGMCLFYSYKWKVYVQVTCFISESVTAVLGYISINWSK